MDIKINWHQLRKLTDGSKQNLIYACDTSKIPDTPGVYIFARLHGQSVDPIYIGESLNLKTRIEQHLKFVPPMQAIENRKSGTRILMYGTLTTGKGCPSQEDRATSRTSTNQYALAQGADLVNWQGTRTPYERSTSTVTSRSATFSAFACTLRSDRGLSREPQARRACYNYCYTARSTFRNLSRRLRISRGVNRAENRVSLVQFRDSASDPRVRREGRTR